MKVAVLINYKICDNAAECGGIETCPAGALFWNQETGRIGIDNNICISCHECENACPVGAIHVADNDSDFLRIHTEIENDSRHVEELFVERYGAMPIDEDLVLDEIQVKQIVKELSLVFIEQFQDSSIQCLLHSIPTELIIGRFGCTYRKQQMPDELEGVYPRLQIYEKGNLIGTVLGYFEDEQINVFIREIERITKS